MLIIKLGGSCLKNAESFPRAVDLIDQYSDDKLVVVVSALGKSTSILSHIVESAFKNKKTFVCLQSLINIHLAALGNLTPPKQIEGERFIVSHIEEIERRLRQLRISDFLRHKDTVLSLGEVLSSKILSLYLEDASQEHRLLDSREIIKTDGHWGNAEVNIDLTKDKFDQAFINSDDDLFVLQGFIASNDNNQTTTLGFEGSDYSASLAAYLLDANKLILYKDVKGIYHHDPDIKESDLIESLSYDELDKILKSGSKIVHRKTIDTLRQKNIPFQVRSFYDLDHKGTIIS